MKITKTLSVADKKDWREWLKRHYRIEKEIWDERALAIFDMHMIYAYNNSI